MAIVTLQEKKKRGGGEKKKRGGQPRSVWQRFEFGRQTSTHAMGIHARALFMPRSQPNPIAHWQPCSTDCAQHSRKCSLSSSGKNRGRMKHGGDPSAALTQARPSLSSDLSGPLLYCELITIIIFFLHYYISAPTCCEIVFFSFSFFFFFC